MNKRSFGVTVVFSLMVFIILSITVLLTGFLTIVLLNLGVIQNPRIEIGVVIVGLVCILVGTVLSHVIGKRPIKVIQSLDNATKEVVKGNFQIQLDENISAKELKSVTHNFNVMVKELANTEIFRKDFVENVSHEFKTPLSAIEGYATLLQKKNLSEEKRIEYTKRILFNSQRLSSLTGNILLLSRLENQEMEVKKESYSLDEQLREAILMFENIWTEKELDLDIDLCLADYTGNKELLMQVWQNILGNAVKFVEKQGKIQVILKSNPESVQVSIIDNGIGMDENTQKRIFEKFYQADASRAGIGNGLGLTLAKRIIDLHHGSVSVSSKQGKGTAFVITLPVQS
ncbi:MAG: HAMP domain-containing sensor histidine kinase [Lachnoclostridium edouardi]|uniref:sensor histidine kinase n=1 Tax=Lachnoclostridium edouardi TaxID=1926283 RepID=UPI0026DC7448|nr:HAMP domain-containing sensor histidine kinase [Lachnoclostridium edouardi]MDO4278249.1 HAMP domain-containing sensor histidine kinase [Lachnoclostridium edouardi]